MMIQGLLGPIDTAELGQTLMHEHITCADWSMRMNFGARFFEFDQVAEIAAGQLGKAKALGCLLYTSAARHLPGRGRGGVRRGAGRHD